MKKTVVFTDLDGTLLDERYSFEPAREMLEELKSKSIPVVLCTSKTLPEVLHYRKLMSLRDPFVVENGGAVYYEKGYFRTNPREALEWDSFYVIKFGVSYESLIKALERLKRMGFKVKGFHEMSDKEVAELTGLGINEAKLARQRQFDEVFVFEGKGKDILDLQKAIEDMGLSYTYGRLHHIKGHFTKGTAVKSLKELFEEEFGEIITIGLGDSRNDYEMLKEVDFPVVVAQNGKYEPSLTGFVTAYYTERSGPEGWVEAISRILSKIQQV